MSWGDLSDWSSLFVGLGALAVSIAVYRTQAGSFYLTALTPRRKAFDELIAAYDARWNEISKRVAEGDDSIGAVTPAMQSIWKARVEVGSLFGEEVVQATKAMDSALIELAGKGDTLVAIRRDGGDQRAAGKDYLGAGNALLRYREALFLSAKPYVALGRRGLSFWDLLAARKARESVGQG